MKKPPIDFKKLRNGEKVNCPECKEGVFQTKYDPKTTHHFKCDKCGLSINFD
jgi:uncharacterized protein (DUF983 family)